LAESTLCRLITFRSRVANLFCSSAFTTVTYLARRPLSDFLCSLPAAAQTPELAEGRKKSYYVRVTGKRKRPLNG